MKTLKDKLIEIAKEEIGDNATIDCKDDITLDCNAVDHACEAIADNIIELLRKWLEIPA